MDSAINKSIRNGWYVWIFASFLALCFGVYDFIVGYEIVSILNVLYLAIGIILAGIGPFMLTFIFSLLFFYFRENTHS